MMLGCLSKVSLWAYCAPAPIVTIGRVAGLLDFGGVWGRVGAMKCHTR